jgi:hypothetical protein
VTTPTNVPAEGKPTHRRRGDDAFFAVASPQCAEDETHSDMRELRAIADASALRTSRHWLRAVGFLRELDHLDQAHASGRLDAESYAGSLAELYRTAPHETWLCAVGLARMVERLMRYRQHETGGAS